MNTSTAKYNKKPLFGFRFEKSLMQGLFEFTEVNRMKKLEAALGYRFTQSALLDTALTHSSYANEAKRHDVVCNERMEFLGDTVLGFIVSDYIFRHYPELPEGKLTKVRASLVCEAALHKYAGRVGLGAYLKLGKGEEASGGRDRPSILADAFEAVLAGMYLDGGLEHVKTFLMPFIREELDQIDTEESFHDYKTLLQEIVQKNKEEILSYELIDQKGPDHNKRFVVGVYLNSNQIATGEGKSKKEAEQNAAKAALALMGQ